MKHGPRTTLTVLELIAVSLMLFEVAPSEAVPQTQKDIRNPSATSGLWINGTSAFLNDNVYASTETIYERRQNWTGFGFNIDGNAKIVSVRVIMEYFDNDGAFYMRLRLFNGTSFSSSYTVYHAESEVRTEIDVSNAFSWTPAMINAVKTELKPINIEGLPGLYVWVDWIAVEVSFKMQGSAGGDPVSVSGKVFIPVVLIVAVVVLFFVLFRGKLRF